MEKTPSVIDLSQSAAGIEQAFAQVPRLMVHFSSQTCSVCDSTLSQVMKVGKD